MPRTVVAFLFAVGGVATSGVVYAPLNLWPYPQHVDLPEALGPHGVSSPELSVQDCDPAVPELVKSSLQQHVIFRDTIRSYDEMPYQAKDAFCPTSLRCADASDCVGDMVCLTDSAQHFNSTHACPPSAHYNAPCGCCVPKAGPPLIGSISISCAIDGIPVEGYKLNVTSDGITIVAASSRGAAYGVATLSQLLRWEPEVNLGILERVPLYIDDAPTFPWRGMMVDTSRSFVPVSQLLQLLDSMFAAKMNTFHWHIVDSPSFPYDSKKFPELAKEGSWSQSGDTIYSTDDVHMVLRRAQDRFVEVVFEFDTPAHTMGWSRSHPEIMTDCWEWLAKENSKVDVDSDDCMAMDPTAPEAELLVQALLQEVVEMQGNSGHYLHLGGDEVKVGCWNSSERIRAHVQAEYGDLSENSFKHLQLDWTKRLAEKIVIANGKVPVIWQPTGAGAADPIWDPSKSGMSNDTIYMAWLSAKSVTTYVQAGSRVVNTEPFYVAGMGAGGWKQVYDAQIAPSDLSDEQRALVLGGQICMWGETFGAGNFNMRAYQIGMGAAENFWGKYASGEVGGWALQTRYNRFLCHLKNWGIDSPPQMPGWCGVVRASEAAIPLTI